MSVEYFLPLAQRVAMSQFADSMIVLEGALSVEFEVNEDQSVTCRAELPNGDRRIRRLSRGGTRIAEITS